MKHDKKYINVRDYYDERYPYQFFVGGRGTGKTYSGLGMCVDMQMEKLVNRFIYMRRTEKEMEACVDNRLRGEFMNPFKSLNADNGWNYGFMPVQKSVSGLYKRQWDEETGKVEVQSDLLGYGIALTTISSLRGIDLTDCDITVYDEFIPERHVKRISNEGEAFLNAIETIARNRELKGKKPMMVFCFANAFNIHNALFQELGLIDTVEKMVNRHQYDYYNQERGLSIHLLEDSKEFKQEKLDSSLYRLARGTRFNDMALENSFAYNDFSLIGFENVRGMRPVVRLRFDTESITVWEKKGQEHFYLSYCPGKAQSLDVRTEHERRYFVRYYGRDLMDCFIRGTVYFETYAIKQKFLDAVGIK